MKEKGNDLIIFESNNIRRYYKKDEEEWYYSILDVISTPIDTLNSQCYWAELKKEIVGDNMKGNIEIKKFKMKAKDGKMRETDCATLPNILKILMSCPSKNVEDFKIQLVEFLIFQLENELGKSNCDKKLHNWFVHYCNTIEKPNRQNNKKKPNRVISGRVRQNVLMRDNYTCQICGATVKDGAKLHIDHIKPLSKGGTNDESNLQVLCQQCNLEKHNRTDLLHDKLKLKELQDMGMLL